jgi:hypothetical protein
MWNLDSKKKKDKNVKGRLLGGTIKRWGGKKGWG